MSADELDVDAELLAMAGDDSSDAESDAPDEQTQTVNHELRSPSEEVKPSVEKPTVDEPPPSARRGVAQKVRKRRKKADRDRRRDQEILDDLDDLDDGSSSAPASPGSEAMMDPGSDADAPASPIDTQEDAPLYPYEGKFLSAEDRRTILSLPEIERESILAERAAEVLKRQQDLQLQKAFATSQAQTSKNQKRKAAAADLDDGVRKSSRAKTEKTGRSALDDYKKAREAKGAERSSRLDAGGRGGKRSQSASASDRDADGESEVEWAEPASRSRRDEPAAELKDVDRCRIGRSAFAKIHFYPHFEETMKGCFARVSIGMNRETGQNMYRMTQIKGFTQGKPYTLELSNGKTYQTDTYALVSHGLAEKPWPFSACSDSAFTDAEFQHYKATLEKERIRLPKRLWLHQKLDDLHRFLNIDWDEQTLQGKFTRQREMEKRVNPANMVNVKRQDILRRKREAEETEDVEEVARCDAELAALENNTATSNSAPKAKPSPAKQLGGAAQSSQERLALINQKNRGKNADDVRKALLEERKKLHREREKAAAMAKAKAAADAERKKAELLGVPGGDMAELFGSDLSRAGTPMSGTSTPGGIRGSRASTPMNGLGSMKKDRSGLGMMLGKKKVDDELGGLDLGIDVEI